MTIDSEFSPSILYSYSEFPAPSATRAVGGAERPKLLVASSSVMTARTCAMSAGTAPSDTFSEAACPVAPGTSCTPGPVGWLKKTKSASERTFPESVTSSADRSAAAVSSRETMTSSTLSGPF